MHFAGLVVTLSWLTIRSGAKSKASKIYKHLYHRCICFYTMITHYYNTNFHILIFLLTKKMNRERELKNYCKNVHFAFFVKFDVALATLA